MRDIDADLARLQDGRDIDRDLKNLEGLNLRTKRN